MFIYWKIYEERVGNCELFYILRRKNNRDIVSAFLSCLSSISLDFLRCRFILSQIVQNAIKYFDKQENKLTIYSQDNGTNILLVIEDNGCGIKTSDLSRVFEKGFTGSNRNKANATGMGLYLSKKLCDRLGLKLDIASTEKEYTRLTIIFPKGTVHNFSE